MALLPAIYTIQASDAHQYTSKLQEILHNLKKENRIEDFTIMDVNENLSAITDNIGKEDLILIVLTNQLESHKKQIEAGFKVLKTNRPEIRIAEIIIDNVPYENEFITFPVDLRPIRHREDMDTVWRSIEQNLKDMFTVPSSVITNTAWWTIVMGLFALLVFFAGFFVHHDLPGLLGLFGIPIVFIILALLRPVKPLTAAAFVFGVSTVAFFTEPVYKLIYGMRLQSGSQWVPLIVLIIVIYTSISAAICWWRRIRLMRD